MPVLALAALEPIILALMALLLYMAFRPLVRAVASVLPNWHIPGFSALRDWVMGYVESAYADVRNWTDVAIHAVAHAISYPVTFFRQLFRDISAIGHAVFVTIAFIVTVKIPAYFLNAVHYAQRLYNQAIAYVVSRIAALTAYVVTLYHSAISVAEGLYNRAIAYIVARITALTAYVVTLYHSAISVAEGLYNRAIAYIVARITALTAYALSLYHQSIAYIDARADTLTHYAEQLYNKAISYADATARAAVAALLGTLNGAASIAIAQLWPVLITDIDKLAATAADDFTDVVTDLRAATRAIPRDLVGAIALAPAIAIPLIRMVERCVIPNCRNLSQFGRDLQAILDLAGGVELVGLIAELATNPQGAADELRAFVVDPIAAVSRNVESLIGV